MKLVKQGDEDQFKNKTILFHFEFTDVCNQHCSYCVEGNFYLDKPKVEYSKKENLIGALDKIFNAYSEDIKLGFILVGGEPTTQECFLDVVNKIKTRKNAFQILTTNFTQSVEYYKTLDIPLVTSLHLDSFEPVDWLKKTLEVKDLISHTRIMAHPQKMDKVKEAYDLFLEASKTTPLSFAVEEIMDFSLNIGNKIISYSANYLPQDLEFVKSCHPIDAVYPDSLNKKMGILKNIFYRAQWSYGNSLRIKSIKINNMKDDKLEKFYCECSIVLIRSNGSMDYGWACYNSKHNIFKKERFPKEEIKTVICEMKQCPFQMTVTVPRYRYIKYAPEWQNKKKLAVLRISFLWNKCIKNIISTFLRKARSNLQTGL